MNRHLTTGHRALLEAALVLRQHQLESRLQGQLSGLSRAEHAHEVLTQDGDDAPQRSSDREVDLAMTDIETQELGAVQAALSRLKAGAYGVCIDCAGDIPFDRLQAAPVALRCVACAQARESAAHP
jgi:DnaK suppressor protein